RDARVGPAPPRRAGGGRLEEEALAARRSGPRGGGRCRGGGRRGARGPRRRGGAVVAGRGEPRRRPGGPAAKAVAGVAVVGTVTTLAVVAQGYDAQEGPRLETSVWVTRADGQYGRVNTDLAELDTVRAVADPSGVVQAGAAGVVFTQGFGQAWAIDPAAPVDLGAGDDEQGAA